MGSDRVIADARRSREPGRRVSAIFALKRDVPALSLAITFSLSFQMTSRFLPEYIVALGFAVYATFPVVPINTPASTVADPGVRVLWVTVRRVTLT